VSGKKQIPLDLFYLYIHMFSIYCLNILCFDWYRFCILCYRNIQTEHNFLFIYLLICWLHIYLFYIYLCIVYIQWCSYWCRFFVYCAIV